MLLSPYFSFFLLLLCFSISTFFLLLCFFLFMLPLEELHQLGPETWLRGFVVAQRPWGLLVSVAPTAARGARAVGVVLRRGKRSPAVGSEVISRNGKIGRELGEEKRREI